LAERCPFIVNKKLAMRLAQTPFYNIHSSESHCPL
jgi:hypothetical protein